MQLCNISHFCYDIDDDNELRVVIQVNNPVDCLKRYRDAFNAVRSPFNMQQHNQFLNNWNTSQTFFVKGQCDRDDFAAILNILKKCNPDLKIDDKLTVQILSPDAAKKEL